MNSSAQIEPSDKTSASSASDSSAATDSPRANTSSLLRTFAAPLVGAVVTGLVVTAMIGGAEPVASDGTAELSPIAVSQLDDASRTLLPQQASQLTSDAKSCRVPLAYLTLWSSDGSQQTVRIRSGSYVSPAFALTSAPQRIAVPFPAPYATGRGRLSVEGKGQNVAISLTPTWAVAMLTGSAATDVIWNPKNPC